MQDTERAQAVCLDSPDLEELAETLTDPGLTELELNSASDEGWWQVLAAAPLPQLRSLKLWWCTLSAQALSALLESGRFRGLHSLSIDGDEIVEDDPEHNALAPLLQSADLADLTHLRLGLLRIPFYALAHNPQLRRLRVLDIPWGWTGPDVACLLRAPALGEEVLAPWVPRGWDKAVEQARRGPWTEPWVDWLADLIASLDARGGAPERLAELEAALACWPPTSRPALGAWLAAALQGPAPALRRAGMIDLHMLRSSGRRAEDLDALSQLLTHPDAAHIDHVALRFLSLDEAELLRWLGQPWLRRVRVLDLYGSKYSDAVIDTLLNNPETWGLRVLDLSGCFQRGADLRKLLASPLLGRLEGLVLSLTPLSPADFRALWGAAAAAGLRGLHLRSCGLSVEHLQDLPPFPSLHTLKIQENKLGDQAVLALSRVALPGLTVLELGYPKGPPMSDAGAEAIASAPWPRLARLFATFHSIGDAGALALARCPSLRLLDVSDGNCVTREGVRALVQAANPELRFLVDYGSRSEWQQPEMLGARGVALVRGAGVFDGAGSED